MKTTHLETKKQALISKREQLIGKFNESARARGRTPGACVRKSAA